MRFIAAQDRHRGHRIPVSLPASNNRTLSRFHAVYVIDLTHYLDARGAIAPERGPARKMADFLTAVVAHATDFDRPDDTPGPVCFKCRKRDNRRVDTGITGDDVIVWHCGTCSTDGQISRWQHSFWDLSEGMLSD